MPPVILAMICQYFYSFYFDTEYFYGETYIISLGTFIAAAINVGLNFIFIPKYGYIAAAYTTLIGYFIMLVYHFSIVKFKLKKDFLFPTKWFAIVIIVLSLLQLGIAMIFDLRIIRYAVIVLYMIIVCLIGIKYNIPQIVLSRIKSKPSAKQADV